MYVKVQYYIRGKEGMQSWKIPSFREWDWVKQWVYIADTWIPTEKIFGDKFSPFSHGCSGTWSSACLCLLSVGVKGVCYHTGWKIFLEMYYLHKIA